MSLGVKSVDGNSVYRLGSVTKIFTILTFLIEAGDIYWNTPVTQWVPELELLAGKAQYDPIMNVDWDSITLQDLASHMAGIVRDCEYILLDFVAPGRRKVIMEDDMERRWDAGMNLIGT